MASPRLRVSYLCLLLLFSLGTSNVYAFCSQAARIAQQRKGTVSVVASATAGNNNNNNNSSNNNNRKSYASISSDGVVTRRPTGRLGKPSKSKGEPKKPVTNKPMSKKDRQRTANGTIDSNSNSNNNSNNASTASPEDQGVQVVKGNRGNKVVTIIRGMTATSLPDKKTILKTLKTKLGVGGTVVEGVLEIQGDHTVKTVELLRSMGYSKARKIGK